MATSPRSCCQFFDWSKRCPRVVQRSKHVKPKLSCGYCSETLKLFFLCHSDVFLRYQFHRFELWFVLQCVCARILSFKDKALATRSRRRPSQADEIAASRLLTTAPFPDGLHIISLSHSACVNSTFEKYMSALQSKPSKGNGVDANIC